MVRKRHSCLHCVFLAVFVFFAAGVNFFHADGVSGRDPLCPACNFQSSLTKPAELVQVPVPVLVVLAVLPVAAATSRDVTFLVVEPARGPPVL